MKGKAGQRAKKSGQKGENQIKGLDIVSLSLKIERVVYTINCHINLEKTYHYKNTIDF